MLLVFCFVSNCVGVDGSFFLCVCVCEPRDQTLNATSQPFDTLV